MIQKIYMSWSFKLTDPPFGDARINSIPSFPPNFFRKILNGSANSLKYIPREWLEQTTSIRLGGSYKPVVTPTSSFNNFAVEVLLLLPLKTFVNGCGSLWWEWFWPPVVVIYKDKVDSIMNEVS